jgi:membrane protein
MDAQQRRGKCGAGDKGDGWKIGGFSATASDRGQTRVHITPLTETRLWHHVREVGRKFVEDNCTLIAAAISFFALLSVVPMMLLAVAALGSVLSGARAQEIVLDFAREQLPGLENQVANELKTLVQTHEWTGWLGLLGLIWASGQVFANLEVALSLAWHVPRRRGLVHRRALALVMTLLAGVPIVLSFLLTVAITALRQITVPVFGWKLGAIPLVWTLTGELVPVLLTVASFTAVYRWVPNAPVHWRSALLGGLCGGLAWETAKRVFAFYVPNIAQLGHVYGPFTGIVGLMLWIFYSSLILLLGAEITAVAQSVHPITQGPDGEEVTDRLRDVEPGSLPTAGHP